MYHYVSSDRKQLDRNRSSHSDQRTEHDTKATNVVAKRYIDLTKQSKKLDNVCQKTRVVSISHLTDPYVKVYIFVHLPDVIEIFDYSFYIPAACIIIL